MVSPERLSPDPPDESSYYRYHAKYGKEQRRQRAVLKPLPALVIDEIADLPAGDRTTLYGRPQLLAEQQTNMIVGDVRNRVAVDAFCLFQLGQHAVHCLEFVLVGRGKRFQFGEIAPVELHQTASRQSSYD